jgi:hypothetical protein
VSRAVVAEGAEFLILNTPALFALVLGSRVVPALTFIAGEDDEVTRHCSHLIEISIIKSWAIQPAKINHEKDDYTEETEP